MKVLLIEPDAFLAEALMALISARGHEVFWKKTAQSALDSLEDSVPEAIILELQLGLHNGIEFIYELRSYSEWQNIPIIVHTINSKALDETYTSAFEELEVISVTYKLRTTNSHIVRLLDKISVTS